MRQPKSHKRTLMIPVILIVVGSVPCRAQDTSTVWNERREVRHLQNRQDSTTWDWNMLEGDILGHKKRGLSEPINFGAFPVPEYKLLGEGTFNGVGVAGNFAGADVGGKTVLYSYFNVNNNAINRAVIDDTSSEVFFAIVVLTDTVDVANLTHAGVYVTSRNNPDFMGSGFFRTQTDRVDYVAFLTAGRDEYAIVNMRLFNLEHGRIVLIAPQMDGSLRSMQVATPVLSAEEVDGYINQLLKRDDVETFFTADGNI